MKKKIKIIDILCLYETGNYNELPKKIRIKGDIYELSYNHLDNNVNFIYENMYEGCWLDNTKIDEFVEILDEEDEFEDIEEWGVLAFEEVKTKTDYTIKDLQRYIKLLMETQNELTRNQKKIISRLKEEGK